MTSGSWEAVPPGIDISRPHSARMYDYFLGGKDNFAIDRETAEAALQSVPTLRTGVRENRQFLARAVKYLAGEGGIRQFLDIGTGLPGAGNTHEIAQAIAPDSRIVYADNDRYKSGCAHACRTVRLPEANNGVEAPRALRRARAAGTRRTHSQIVLGVSWHHWPAADESRSRRGGVAPSATPAGLYSCVARS
jgi:hypothetical protein